MKPKRILIIDDDVQLCEELAEFLNGEGYSVEHTSDPAEGEGRMRCGGYDAVLLDYKMPELTGADILKRLKEDNIRVSVLMITGKPFIERELEEEGLLDSVCGVISKPLDFGTLLEKIKSAL